MVYMVEGVTPNGLPFEGSVGPTDLKLVLGTKTIWADDPHWQRGWYVRAQDQLGF
jgi:hypothetical protein